MPDDPIEKALERIRRKEKLIGALPYIVCVLNALLLLLCIARMCY